MRSKKGSKRKKLREIGFGNFTDPGSLNGQQQNGEKEGSYEDKIQQHRRRWRWQKVDIRDETNRQEGCQSER